MTGSRELIELLESRTLLTVLVSGFAEETFASGLKRPTAMAFAPDGRLFVTEQDGFLRVIKDGVLKTTAVLNVPADGSVERGLIGLVLDPDFATNKQLYVYWTAKTPTVHNRISRFTLSGDVAVASTRVDILDLPTLSGAANHNGGAMAFGPDGKLYVAVGENANPPQAQDLTNPFGKILRINKDGSIPTSNPFYNSQEGIARAIWAYGLRNTFTFAFQPGTGRFFGNDVGQSKWEEVNEIEKAANYGWPIYEGPAGAAGFERPLITFGHDGPTAIVGGTFYDPDDDYDSPFPSSYNDTYFYAEAVKGHITAVDLSGGDDDLDSDLFADDVPYPVDLDIGPDGALYVLSRVNGYSTPSSGTPRVIRYTFTGSAKPSIGLGPQSQTVPVGNSVTFHVDASGTGLSYQWQRNSVNIPGATDDSYTIDPVELDDNGAKYRVVVTNSAGSATSSSATLTVVDNQPPVPVIDAPLSGLKFVAGEPISFSGHAVDPEDGDIDPLTLTWNVSYFNGGLDRPFLPETQEPGGTIVPEVVSPYLLTDVFLRIRLTATDSEGLSATTSVDVLPTTTTLTIASSVPGLTVSLDGVPFATPHAVDALAGLHRPMSAPLTQELNGVIYDFIGWSDGGEPTHTITTPVEPTTFTAIYEPRVIEPPPPPPPPPPDPEPEPQPGDPPAPAGFDLAPAVLKHSTRPVVAGARGSAAVRVTNRGPVGFAGPLEVKIWLSADAVLDASDLEAATLSKTLRIRPAAHPTVGVRFIYPQVPADGDYVLLARVMPLSVTGGTAGAPPDADPSNNSNAGHDVVHVERAVIDLRGNGVPLAHTPNAVSVAGQVSVTLGVHNAGNVTAAGQLAYAIYAQRVGAPGSEKVLLTTGTKKVHVRARGGVKLSARFAPPVNLPPGDYVLTAVVDTGDIFVEVDEVNNTLTAAVPLTII